MIYDFNTKNTSFIKVAKQLKDEGVKNYKFILQLYDTSLIGIDPHDEDNLTLEQKTRIQREVRINPWYFLRECVRVVETGGNISYQANRGNIAQSFCIFNNIDAIECLPRQNGKTIGAEGCYLWIYHFATINTNILFSNKQYADSQLNIKRFNDMTEALPKFLLTHLNEKEDTNNLTEIRCESTNNTITAMSTARDESSADKLGRGCTVPLIWYDEFAFLKFNKKVFDSAAFALSKASESAQRNGTPYSRLITTTPRLLGGLMVTLTENFFNFWELLVIS